MERCEKCGSQKILQNDDLVCIFCFGKQQVIPKRAPVQIEDPGDAGLAKLTGESIKSHPKSQAQVIAKPHAATGTAKDALAIMRSLPIPDDIKSFKKIKRIIKQLEELTGEKHDD